MANPSEVPVEERHRRHFDALRSFPAAAAVACLLACGGDGASAETRAGATPVVVPEGEALFARSIDELVILADVLTARASEHEASALGVHHAREGARVARAIVQKGGSARYVDRARRLLAQAARRATLPGACEAGLELARLEAMVSRDPAAAYVAAYRTLQAFSTNEREAVCVDEARRMMDVLSAHRPADSVLAGVHAEQAGARAPSGDAAEVDVVGWAARTVKTAEPPATLEQISVYGAGGDAADGVRRVVLQFDRVAVFRRSEQPAADGVPRRVWIDLDRARVAAGVPRMLPVDAGGLVCIRTEGDGSRTRVSFEVAPETQHRTFFLPDPYRVVIDFAGPAGMAEHRARRGPVIVLDPGHGGQNPGAKANGLKEAHLTLKLARAARAVLQRKLPDATVVLTRGGDDTVSLEERAAMANAAGADLFVSIHLNASHSPTDRGGVSTFVLDTTDDQAALKLAARENETDTQGVSDLQFILASLIRRDQVAHSRVLADEVQRATLAGGRRILTDLPDRGVKSALFYVLVGVTMPAVLVEASFLTRPEEAAALRTDEYRFALADGIARGIIAYLDAGVGAERASGNLVAAR